jgi:ABC-2 type transport system permease protein
MGSVLWPKFKRGRWTVGQRLGRIFFTVTGLGLAVAIYWLSQWFLALCYNVETIGPLLCQRLLDLELMVLLSVLLLSNIVTALSSFFLAQDLQLLNAAPIPPRSLFGARFCEQIFHSSWMVLAFGLPTLLAFKTVAGTPLTYGAIALVVLPLLVFPAAAGLLVALLLVCLLPAARVKNIVVALLFVAFLVFYLLLRLAEPERFINPDGFASMVNLLASLSSPSGSLLPSHWATGVIAATFRDAALTSQPWRLMLAALWTGAAAVYVLTSAIYREIYSRAYARSQEGKGMSQLSLLRFWWRKESPFKDKGPIPSPAPGVSPGVDLVRAVSRLVPQGITREFFVKDVKLLLRDASQWSQLVLLLALIFVYLYNFRHFRQIGESGLIGRTALSLVGMGLSGFVTAAVSVRFAFPLISLEGRMMWLLRTAPLNSQRILRSKLLAVLPPLLFVAEVMSMASSYILGASWAMTLLGAAVAALTAISVSSMAIGIGAILPDYHAESAAKVAASFGGLVCMSLAIIVALALVGFAIYPAHVLHHHHFWRPLRLTFSIVSALTISGIATFMPLYLGARALEKHG